MTIAIREVNQQEIVIAGEMTLENVVSLDNAVQAILSEQAELTISLAEVKHSDSAGVALLVEWTRVAKLANKALRINDVPSQILAIAKLSNLESVLDCHL